jgi:L-amino acid N-acyltransferase YncA
MVERMLTSPARPVEWSIPLPTCDLRIRRATVDDVVELAALKRRVERRCYAHLGTPEALAIRLHRRCTAWYLLGRISAGDLVLVAEDELGLLGLGAAQIDRRAAGPVLHLHSTYVDQPGQGVGRALTRARLSAAHALGVRTVTADCFVGGPESARRMHLLGLVEVGERTASPTYPGAALSHWAGSLQTALDRITP